MKIKPIEHRETYVGQVVRKLNNNCAMSIVGKRVSFNYRYKSETGDSCKSISGTVVDKYISNGNTMYLVQFISDSDLHGNSAFHVEPKDISNVII